MANSFGNCLTDCGDMILPALDVEQDCTSYEIFESQICGLIMTRGAAPADWTDSAEWEALIMNDLEVDAAAKYLIGVGSMPAPEAVTVEGAKFKDIVVKRTYTVSFRVLNMSDAQYNFLTSIQCGQTDYQFWIETAGGHLFGGPTGICPKSSDADLPKDGGRDVYDEGLITIVFESRVDPDRSSWTPISTDVDTVPTVQGYGPIFNNSEAYGPTAGGTEYYSFA